MRAITRRGFAARSAGQPQPIASIVPGRKFSTSTSASAASARTISCAAGLRTSSPRLRLLRLNTAANRLPPRYFGGAPRVGSPSPGFSTLTTSAPMSPSIMAQKGPATNRDRSSTRIPASGPAMAAHPVFPGEAGSL